MKKLAALLILPALFAAEPNVTRPKILGVAHMALFVSDMQKSRAFYKDFLGFDEPFALKNKDGSEDRIVFIKINDRQYIELFTDPPRAGERLNHISIETDDAAGMRNYLASKGIKVPEKAGKGQIKNSNFNINDPDGHIVEIVQYEPDGWSMRDKGKFLPATRISTHMTHVGVLANSLEESTKFYTGILGFKEFWRGSPSATVLSWVNMRVPDGQDYIELMLYDKLPEPDQRGGKNHVCLMVPDVRKAVALLEARPARKNYDKPLEVKVGINRKRQVNIFDPDGTRIELMEPDTVDGKPAPSSTAPPPR